jgi:hypothetical protein
VFSQDVDMVPIASFVALVQTAYRGIVCGGQLNLQLEQGCPAKLGSALGPNGKSRDYLA